MKKIKTDKPIDNTISREKRYQITEDLIYKEWRRRVGDDCYAMDLDWIEWRPKRGVVAVIETRGTDTMLNKWQLKVMLEVANALRVPAYFVRYYVEDNKLIQFKVMNLRNDQTLIMSEEEYLKFIKGL